MERYSFALLLLGVPPYNQVLEDKYHIKYECGKAPSPCVDRHAPSDHISAFLRRELGVPPYVTRNRLQVDSVAQEKVLHRTRRSISPSDPLWSSQWYMVRRYLHIFSPL